MNKLLFLFLITITACNSNDDIPELPAPTIDITRLYKGWEYQTVTINGTTQPYQGNNPGCTRDYFGFRNNPTQPFQHEETYFEYEQCATHSTTTHWGVSGNTIRFWFGADLLKTYEVHGLTNDEFIFETDRDLDGDGLAEHVIFSCVPYDPYNSFDPEG